MIAIAAAAAAQNHMMCACECVCSPCVYQTDEVSIFQWKL